MATKRYFSQDWGEAIFYDGVPYVRRGHVTQDPTDSFGANAQDYNDVGDNNPVGFSNSGESFSYDTNIGSSSWSLEQCIIASRPGGENSIDWYADTNSKDLIAREGFIIAPSDGILRMWTGPNSGDVYVGKNDKYIKTVFDGSDVYDDENNTSFGDSNALRLTAGETIQASGNLESDDITLSSTSDVIFFAWVFLPDYY